MPKDSSLNKCKLMFFVYIFGQGGAERIILNILNHINNTKYDIHLILGEKTAKNQYLSYLTNRNVQIDYLNVPLGQYDQAVNSLAQKINQINPDILFTEAKYTNSIAYHAKKLSKNTHTKLIFREAVNRSACQDEDFLQKIKTSLHYNFGPAKIICISNGVASDLIKHYGVKRKKIAVIHNPADLNFIRKKASGPISNQVFNKIKGKKIITIGRLSPSKNQKLLLEAFGRIKEKNVSLIILGSGELEAELKTYCKDRQIKNVYFLGNVPNPYQYLKACDLFVLSSIREGFGNVIVEAMATGVPVISTDCPSGPKEIIGDNKYGLLTPLNDINALSNAMTKMLNNPKLMHRYSALGKKRSQDFDINNIIKSYENAIDKVYSDTRKD